MLEININETIYQFNAGMGFLREINKTMGAPIDGVPGEKQYIGLRYKIGCLFDGDPEALVDVLCAMNKGCVPRISSKILDDYIENADTDIDELFRVVLDFLGRANVTKKTVAALNEEYEKLKAKQAANQ